MTTQLFGKEDIQQAGEILRKGGLVAIPTETVYGLAANALDPQAVKKIFAAKGRPADNPLIAHIHDFAQLAGLVKQVPEAAKQLAKAFWPGPLTMILEKADIVPLETTGGQETVAVRFPAHPLAQAVIQAAGTPLAAPSANSSGKPSPTSFSHVVEDLSGKIDAILDGGDCPVGLESTVISLTGKTPRVLRPGGITVEALRQVLGQVDVDPAVEKGLALGAKASSPGMKYRHYAPGCPLEILDASPEEFSGYVNQKAKEMPGIAALCFRETIPHLQVPFFCYGGRYDSQEQAKLLFSALHQIDRLGAARVYAQQPARAGMGLAVYNRLIRAAGFQKVCLPGPTVVGLVGPSGAGKSTVAAELAKLGCHVVDCDQLTRRSDVYDSGCIAQLCQAFGDSVAPNGILNRRELAARAFSSPEGKQLLEKITFPPILRRIRQELERKTGVVLLDAPTLFEAGLDSICRRILAVSAPEPERLARILKRDSLSQAQVLQRFRAQYPEEFYTCRADWIITNAPGQNITAQVKTVMAELQAGGRV